MSFTRTKDRILHVYNRAAAWLARRPRPLRRAGYGVFGAILWVAYLLPGNSVRPTFKALARHSGKPGVTRLFADFVRHFCLGIDRLEQLRHGRTNALEEMLRIPDEDILTGALEKGGAILLLPHAHASLPMGRGLSRRHAYLALVRSAKDERRGDAGTELFRHLGCETLNIRQEKPTHVARKVLSALGEGRLVIALVDRIGDPPPADDPINRSHDLVRATAFGQPVGVPGWPARFAAKAGVPILTGMVTQSTDAITLVPGQPVTASDDLIGTSQAWLDVLVGQLRAHPEEWSFALDKHWSRTLRAAPPAPN